MYEWAKMYNGRSYHSRIFTEKKTHGIYIDDAPLNKINLCYTSANELFLRHICALIIATSFLFLTAHILQCLIKKLFQKTVEKNSN